MVQTVLDTRQLNYGIPCQKRPGKLHLLTITNSLSRPGMVLHANAPYVSKYFIFKTVLLVLGLLHMVNIFA